MIILIIIFIWWPIFFFLLLFLAGLGEYQIRDINDEINKLLKEKNAWEHRIIKLGGANYLVSIFSFYFPFFFFFFFRNPLTAPFPFTLILSIKRLGPKVLTKDGKEVPGNKGYKLVFCFSFSLNKFIKAKTSPSYFQGTLEQPKISQVFATCWKCTVTF